MDHSHLWYFEKAKLFELICPVKFGEYRKNHSVNTYKKGEFVYFTGDPSNNVFLVSQGKVKILTYTDKGEEVIKGILSRGDIFGELALLGENKRNDFAQVVSGETSVCQMSIDLLRELMQDNKDFALTINKVIGHRILKLERRLDSLVFKDVRTRLIEFLREMAGSVSPANDGSYRIKHYYTHRDIAGLIGTSRQTVTTIFNDLRNTGLIDFSRKEIRILNLDALTV